MSTHPNRSTKPGEGANPSTEEIQTARITAGLSQRAAAEMIWCSTRAWEQWEAGERRMPYVTWWAFQRRIKDKKL
ncbi:DNA-binding transcriptional regulator YiaG [Variovorax sp. GrIS 2.14]|jgi:DNA-binding transcriptional regulator YiaG|uniref:XRE family transcriptional regulator n=1 Tax=Variovorax sp. GrIS 2.14 TaxID=3071709 RepID=UPI0038F70093